VRISFLNEIAWILKHQSARQITIEEEFVDSRTGVMYQSLHCVALLSRNGEIMNIECCLIESVLSHPKSFVMSPNDAFINAIEIKDVMMNSRMYDK
jgi:hypothetical protein